MTGVGLWLLRVAMMAAAVPAPAPIRIHFRTPRFFFGVWSCGAAACLVQTAVVDAWALRGGATVGIFSAQPADAFSGAVLTPSSGFRANAVSSNWLTESDTTRMTLAASLRLGLDLISGSFRIRDFESPVPTRNARTAAKTDQAPQFLLSPTYCSVETQRGNLRPNTGLDV